jgi:2-hydroxy-6-oxonona-2,4-dienedioate hydrolase
MMETTTREYLRINDANIYYEAAGQGETMLFGHAGFVDSRMWDEQFAFFAQYYRVIRFDMSGFGKSDAATGPVNRREELCQLMQQLDIEKAVLVGCSLSGEAIIDFTIEHPEMVSALVAVSSVPGGFEMQGEPPPDLLEMISALQQNDLQRASELQLRLWVDGPFRQPEQVDEQVRRQAAEMNRIPVTNNTWFTADLQALNPLAPPAVNRLNEIRVPTLIIAGEQDHPEILRAAAFLEESILHSRKVILPASGHVTNMEQPEAFNQAVLEFLR